MIHPFALWFTGLPCSGKTTLATILAQQMLVWRLPVEQLDGDSFRKSHSAELGYSKEDRQKNISRAAAAASLFLKEGKIALASFVSPYLQMRLNSRNLMAPYFVEIYLDCPLSVCEQRDVKGMYRLAREGKIQNFTGISGVYEPPLNAEITLRTDLLNIENCIIRIIDYLKAKQFISPARQPQLIA